MPKPKLISSPDELFNHFIAYKKWVKEHPYLFNDYVGKDAVEVNKKRERPLTWSGFEGFLAESGIISHLAHYEQNTGDAYTDYLPIIRVIKKICRADTIDGALAGVYNQNIAARIEGLKDSQEIEHKIDERQVFKIAGQTIEF